MSRWRIAALALLAGLPILGWVALGWLWLWQRGWMFHAWFPMAACFAAAYLLAYRWTRSRKLLPPPADVQPYWTERDAAAWKLVESRAAEAKNVPVEKLGDAHFYVDSARAMAFDLARHYRPNAADPGGIVTIPEVLSVIELASHDLREMVDQYLPGGHLLTIADWQKAKQAGEWYQRANNAYWMISALFSPVETGVRFTAAQLGLAAPWRMVQQNLIDWFYTAYLHRVGHYLIELYSGRLRVGAARYRELMAENQPAAVRPDGATAAADRPVTITLIGQVNAGKSSLVNALLGEQRAKADALPATDGVTPYESKLHDARLRLFDTVGYGHEGPREDQLAATERAARDSDALLLVLHGRTAARHADAEMLKRLREWFARRPDLKMPPVVAVVTHVDLLSPPLEWSPPYDWRKALRPKERSIQNAVLAAREALGDLPTVPVCTAVERLWGIDEELLPALAARLDEGRGVALVRVLKAEADAGRVAKVFGQLYDAGKLAAEVATRMVVPKSAGGGR